MGIGHRELSPAFLETLLEDAPFGLAVLDRDFRYVRVNEHLAATTGIAPEDHEGRTVAEVVPHIAAEVTAALEALAAGSGPLTRDMTVASTADPAETRHLQVIYLPVRGEGYAVIVLDQTETRVAAEQRTRYYELERDARARAEQAEGRAQFILEAGTLLDTSLDLRTTLRTLCRIAVPRLAHLCMIDMVGSDGEVSRVAVAHADPRTEELVWEMTRRWPSPRDSGGDIRETIRDGVTHYLPTVDAAALDRTFPDPEQRRLVEALELRSAIVVPLRARDRTLGAVTIALSGEGKPFTPSDVSLVQDLARRAALSVDNSRLFTDLRRADRGQRFLSEASRALAGSLDWTTTLATVARLTVSGIADMCVVCELDPLGDVRITSVQHTNPEKARALAEMLERFPPGPDSFVARVLQGGETSVVAMDDADWSGAVTDAAYAEALRDLNLVSAMWVPMFAGARLLGALCLGITESDRRFRAEDVALAEELSRRAGVAADNARLYSERSRVARTLQRSLMPARLPEIPDLEVASRFRAAGDGTEVGGDFYDVWETSPGHWSTVVGDVCGKGAEAAALTALARHTIRAASRYEDGPAGVLRTLNLAIAEQSPELLFCTAALVELRPRPGHTRLRAALGGHLPPLVVRAGGEVEELAARGALLGVFPEVDLGEVESELGPGDAVVLYTDGVTEAGAPGNPLGEEELAALLGGLAGRPAAEIAAEVERRVLEVERDAPRDDIAILVLRCTG